MQVKVIIEKNLTTEKKLKLKDISPGETNLSGYENTIGTSNVNNSEKIDISSKSLLEQKIINLFGAEDITGRIEGN